MLKNKQRQIILASLLATGLTLSALFLLTSPNKQVSRDGGKEPALENSVLDEKPRLIEPTKRLTEQPLATISTPSEHDQLVISATLDGTSIDGALRADANRALILELGVRDFFDYFLSIADDVGAE
jgi:hypothetical protein